MSKLKDMRGVCELYREASRVPMVVAARLEAVSKDHITLTSRWSQTNLGSQQKLSFTKTHVVATESLQQVVETSPVAESGRELATRRGEVVAVVRTGKAPEDVQMVEVWKGGALHRSFNMKEVDKHGRIYTDGEFGSLQLSEDLERLLYVAETKKPKSVPFLNQGEVPPTAEVGTESKYREEWGGAAGGEEPELPGGAAPLPYTAHYIGPGEGEAASTPLIVWPHGGPHSVVTTEYKTVVTFFTSLGFGVLFVNYRGSTGLGEENVRSLLGRVGEMDVADVHRARELCLERMPHLDPAKVVLMGGSHGGFLVTHLAGQHPSSYRGVVARNPVTNIASMAGSTDIPDWTYNEAGLGFPWSPAGPGAMETMWSSSPVSHLQHVTAPIFLMIGKNDLRVPPSQGYEFYHALKALGKDVRMNLYDDNHPLAKPENDANVMIHAAMFFQECIAD